MSQFTGNEILLTNNIYVIVSSVNARYQSSTPFAREKQVRLPGHHRGARVRNSAKEIININESITVVYASRPRRQRYFERKRHQIFIWNGRLTRIALGAGKGISKGTTKTKKPRGR